MDCFHYFQIINSICPAWEVQGQGMLLNHEHHWNTLSRVTIRMDSWFVQSPRLFFEHTNCLEHFYCQKIEDARCICVVNFSLSSGTPESGYVKSFLNMIERKHTRKYICTLLPNTHLRLMAAVDSFVLFSFVRFFFPSIQMFLQCILVKSK